jgi:hypothetical protein
MLLLGSFIRRPPPELTIIPLDGEHLSSHELTGWLGHYPEPDDVLSLLRKRLT